jgi:hypothetical protein
MINIQIMIMIWIAVNSILNHGRGTGGSFTDENDMALYLITVLPFCYYLFFFERNPKRKLLYLTGLLISLTAIVVTFSRGGFVGLLSVGFVIWLFSRNKATSAFVICILGLMLFLLGSEEYWQDMSTISNLEDGTAKARFESWAAAWRMFLDHPFGVGGNNFQVLFSEYQSDWFGRGMWGRVAHSLWFTLLPELGIIGVMIYFKLLYHNIKDVWFLKSIDAGDNIDLQYLKTLSFSMIAVLAGFFASASFISVLYYQFYWYLIPIILASVRLAKTMLPKDINGSPYHEKS